MQRLQMNLLLQGEQLQLSVKSERPIDRRNDIFIAQKIIQLVINSPFENFSSNGNDWNRSIII